MAQVCLFRSFDKAECNKACFLSHPYHREVNPISNYSDLYFHVSSQLACELLLLLFLFVEIFRRKKSNITTGKLLRDSKEEEEEELSPTKLNQLHKQKSFRLSPEIILTVL